jgi:hypothetical protein
MISYRFKFSFYLIIIIIRHHHIFVADPEGSKPLFPKPAITQDFKPHISVSLVHIIIIIIVIYLITRLGICLVGKFHLSQIVRVKLSKGKEIHPTVNLGTILHVSCSTALFPTLKMILVKHLFSRYFRKV